MKPPVLRLRPPTDGAAVSSSLARARQKQVPGEGRSPIMGKNEHLLVEVDTAPAGGVLVKCACGWQHMQTEGRVTHMTRLALNAWKTHKAGVA